MRLPIVVAGGLAIAAAAWIASGQFGGKETHANSDGTGRANEPAPAELVSVRVRETFARSRARRISVNGRTEESRRVTLRAETAGPVAATLADEGRQVAAGDPVIRLDIEDRKARLAESEALVRQREIEYRAATELSKKGFRSDTKLAEARALLDAARARTKSMTIDIARTVIRAPFAGFLEKRFVEKGDYLKVGDSIASIVDLDPVLAVGYVSERDIANVRVGTAGTARLVDGQTAQGTVRFVSAVAEPETRTFRVELEIANTGNLVRAGLTGEILLPLPDIRAHLLSPAVLTLSDEGLIGVRVVGKDDVVAFVPVRIVADTPDGIWVTGLEDGTRVITVGHEFVTAGQKVRPVPETPETAS